MTPFLVLWLSLGAKSRRELLDQILQETQKGDLSLPSLRRDPWFWQKWLKDAWDWLGHLLRPFFENSSVDWVQAVKLTLYTIIGILLIYIIWRIYTALKPLAAYRLTAAGPNESLPFAPEKLEEILSQALANKDYALALRVRWCIYLRSKGLNLARTPGELLGGQSACNDHLNQLYLGMFGLPADPELNYQSAAAFLQGLEAKA